MLGNEHECTQRICYNWLSMFVESLTVRRIVAMADHRHG